MGSDTTVAIAGFTEGLPIADVLRMSAKAASIAVTREGAVPSIPYRREVIKAFEAETSDL